MFPNIRTKFILVAQANKYVFSESEGLGVFQEEWQTHTDFQEGKITEENVHGSLESLVCPAYENNDAISHQSYHIDNQKHHKKKHLEIETPVLWPPHAKS